MSNENCDFDVRAYFAAIIEDREQRYAEWGQAHQGRGLSKEAYDQMKKQQCVVHAAVNMILNTFSDDEEAMEAISDLGYLCKMLDDGQNIQRESSLLKYLEDEGNLNKLL